MSIIDTKPTAKIYWSGVSSTMDCEDQISELESILDSQVTAIFLFCFDSWVVNVRYYWWITCDDLQSYNLHTQVYTVEDKTEMEVYAPTAKETRRFYNPTWFSSLDLKEKIKASWSKVPPVILTTSFSMYSVDANKSLNAWTEWCFVFKAARINTKQF